MNFYLYTLAMSSDDNFVYIHNKRSIFFSSEREALEQSEDHDTDNDTNLVIDTWKIELNKDQALDLAEMRYDDVEEGESWDDVLKQAKEFIIENHRKRNINLVEYLDVKNKFNLIENRQVLGGNEQLSGKNSLPSNQNKFFLRNEINRQLGSIYVPRVHQEIQTPEGYANIEHRIAEMCLRNRMTPREVIPQLESEFSEAENLEDDNSDQIPGLDMFEEIDE